MKTFTNSCYFLFILRIREIASSFRFASFLAMTEKIVKILAWLIFNIF